MPEPEPIVATNGALLIHDPPVVTSPSVIDAPWHTAAGPVIPEGVGLTVMVAVREQQSPME